MRFYWVIFILICSVKQVICQEKNKALNVEIASPLEASESLREKTLEVIKNNTKYDYFTLAYIDKSAFSNLKSGNIAFFASGSHSSFVVFFNKTHQFLEIQETMHCDALETAEYYQLLPIFLKHLAIEMNFSDPNMTEEICKYYITKVINTKSTFYELFFDAQNEGKLEKINMFDKKLKLIKQKKTTSK
jgi:hypothetical protein